MVGCYAAGHSDYLLAYGQLPIAYRWDISSYLSQFQFVLGSIDPRNRLVSLLHAAYHLLFVVISMLYMRLTEFIRPTCYIALWQNGWPPLVSTVEFNTYPFTTMDE